MSGSIRDFSAETAMAFNRIMEAGKRINPDDVYVSYHIIELGVRVNGIGNNDSRHCRLNRVVTWADLVTMNVDPLEMCAAEIVTVLRAQMEASNAGR